MVSSAPLTCCVKTGSWNHDRSRLYIRLSGTTGIGTVGSAGDPGLLISVSNAWLNASVVVAASICGSACSRALSRLTVQFAVSE
ncbi:MAG TPA: hypothetical protein PKN44_05740 [Bacteroidales bacterium]|nr:hypothetical protein [Bacteroidales bacterium]HPS50300.1 hypothetical protein [Bacteroidales bacterium]